MLGSKFQKIVELMINKQINRSDLKVHEVKNILEDMKDLQENNRYSKIVSALTDIEQSHLEENEEKKIILQLIAQSKLNEGIDSVLNGYVKNITYFSLWDERSFTEKIFGSRKYTEKNIEKVLNQLCEDYVYLKKAIQSLIRLKISQGVNKENLEELFIKLNGLDELIKNNKIYNWLPIEDEMNSWQHKLLYGNEYDKHFLEDYYEREKEYFLDEEITKYKSLIDKEMFKNLLKKWSKR